MTERHDKALVDFPLKSEDLRRRPREAATDAVPEKLQALSPPVPRARKTLKFIKRSEPTARSADVLHAYRPPWVEASFVPRSVRLSERREVRYRGERFTPLSHCHFNGTDGRDTYNDTSYPWGCVCKITNPTGGTGSGALIGPRHILTASHVLDWNSDEADKIELHL